MANAVVTRPIVRSFKPPHEARAARHVRAGGHALVWESSRRVKLYFRKPVDDDDLGYWSMLDLSRKRYAVAKAGAFAGLSYLVVPKDAVEIVESRALRDSVLEGTTTDAEYDCMACGACCRDNEVILQDLDVERFREAGRRDLLRPPFSRRKDGKLVLTLAKSRRCKHLLADNACNIYDIRPEACRAFPMGSESCLFAREVELGIYEGLPPSERESGGAR